MNLKALAQCQDCGWTKAGRGLGLTEVKSKARKHSYEEGHTVILDITQTEVLEETMSRG